MDLINEKRRKSQAPLRSTLLDPIKRSRCPVTLYRMKLNISVPTKGRFPFTVSDHQSVLYLKQLAIRRLMLPMYDEVIHLIYKNTILNDDWILGDIGITAGSTLHVQFGKTTNKGMLVYSTLTKKHHEAFGLHPFTSTVGDLRSKVTRLTGIPVSIFRLVSPTGLEMYDHYLLDQYGIDRNDITQMEVWNGWQRFLKAACRGDTHRMFELISHMNRVMFDFHLKVAMYIGCHYGHEDLVTALIKKGLRGDEATGPHPSQIWASTHQSTDSIHPDLFRTPLHVAVESQQLGILRTLVSNDLSVILAKDGRGLLPLNVALRTKSRQCARFLLTRQWAQLHFKEISLTLHMYRGLKRWGERARQSAIAYLAEDGKRHKKHTYDQPPALVAIGQTKMHIDGFNSRNRLAQIEKKPKDQISLKRQLNTLQLSPLAKHVVDKQRVARKMKSQFGVKWKDRCRDSKKGKSKKTTRGLLQKMEDSSKPMLMSPNYLNIPKTNQNISTTPTTQSEESSKSVSSFSEVVDMVLANKADLNAQQSSEKRENENQDRDNISEVKSDNPNENQLLVAPQDEDSRITSVRSKTREPVSVGGKAGSKVHITLQKSFSFISTAADLKGQEKKSSNDAAASDEESKKESIESGSDRDEYSFDEDNDEDITTTSLTDSYKDPDVADAPGYVPLYLKKRPWHEFLLPFDASERLEGGPIDMIRREYERYRGVSYKEESHQCMLIANRFADRHTKSWLAQVNRAMGASKNRVRRPALPTAASL